MHLVSRGAFIAAIVLAAAIGACGGGEENPPSATPSVSPSASPSGTPEGTLPPLTLSATVNPHSVVSGETVTVSFTSAPRAIIGFRVIDAAGDTVVEDTARAGADGIAEYELVATGAAGTWLLSAAAGRTILDLLRLQAAPVPGPNTADVSFEVR